MFCSLLEPQFQCDNLISEIDSVELFKSCLNLIDGQTITISVTSEQIDGDFENFATFERFIRFFLLRLEQEGVSVTNILLLLLLLEDLIIIERPKICLVLSVKVVAVVFSFCIIYQME